MKYMKYEFTLVHEAVFLIVWADLNEVISRWDYLNKELV